MAELKTTYMGIELKNPIILGASNLVTDVEKIKKAEEAGAAAIVYKSLFEEQIHLENLEMDQAMEDYEDRYAEMVSMFPKIEHAGPEEHLRNLKKAKDSVNIPVIASLNCVYKETWLEYAQKIQETGVDAIELNFYAAPKNFDVLGSSIVNEQIEIIQEVKSNLDIPVSVKLSPYYTNPPAVIATMDKSGADGFVLFNRLFQSEIDIDKEELTFPWNLSQPGDNRLAIRYAGLLRGNINANICANTGILTGNDVVQVLLAGADVAQVVSTVYKNKIGYISQMLSDVEKWMDKKGYQNIDAFKGKMSKKNLSDDPYAYTRAQYVDILLHSQNVFNKYPMV